MATTPENQSRVLGWIGAAIVGGLILAFAALAFTNSRNAGETLEEAAALHTADMTLVAQDVAMKSIGQLVLLAQDRELGTASDDSVAAAATEVERAIAALMSRFDSLDEETSNALTPAFWAWEEAASDVINLAIAGEPTAASRELVTTLVPAAEELAGVVTVERNERAKAVDDAQNLVGRAAQIAGFLTAFLLPLGAIVAYRMSTRNQIEVAEAHLDARLEAEKSVGRAKDQFIANISHELRTPLASIYGFSEVLLDQGFVDPAAAGDLVGLINTESAELARMVEDLLVAAHDSDAPLAMESVPVDVEQELDTVMAPFRRRGTEIGGTYGPGTVLGDQLRIRQILRNLVSNAIQHGGDTIRVYGDVAGNNYVVSVEDDGPGVPENVESRLFSRFVHQGDAPLTAGSVGLGLAVAHLLANSMEGNLEYDRVPGRTGFVLSLPMVQGSPPADVDDELLAAAPE
ncbi:MAG: HAMP domain-containing histidine kinase [bacterium]|nr:HAMP domain-containing histidine kinase [bacterium]